MLNPTCNHVSVVSWCSVLLVEETEITGENQINKLSHLSCIDQTPVKLSIRQIYKLKRTTSQIIYLYVNASPMFVDDRVVI